MNKQYMAIILVTVGVIVYFFPQFSELTQEKNQLTGAVFTIGGAILWYLPQATGKKRSK